MSNFIYSPKARQILEDWRQFKGIARKPVFTDRLSSDFHSMVAGQFETQQTDRKPETLQAYNQLALELDAQCAFIASRGIQIVPCKEDSYRHYRDMVADIETNSRLKVYASYLEHSLLSDNANFDFRTAHDFFAHSAYGNPFGESPLGEENAYRVHLATLSDLAGKAIATETRGQNSWFHFGPNSRKSTSDKTFADQKSFILPDWARGLYLIKEGSV